MKSKQRGFLLYPARFSSGAGASDPYFSNVSLLLHCDGVNGSTVFTDSSPSPKTVNALGTAAITTAQSKFGGASASFTVAGTRALSVPHNTALNLSSGDFTIEFWFFLTGNLAGAYLLDKDGRNGVSHPSYAVTASSSGVTFYLGSGTSLAALQQFTGATPVTANAWHHAAFTRSGSTVRGFLNGVQQFSTAQTVTINDGGRALNVGARYDGTNFPMLGYIDELRITKGVARYTANFTPPNTPFPNS